MQSTHLQVIPNKAPKIQQAANYKHKRKPVDFFLAQYERLLQLPQ